MFAVGCIKTPSQIQVTGSEGLLEKGKHFLQKFNLKAYAKVNFYKFLFSLVGQSNALDLLSLLLRSLFLGSNNDRKPSHLDYKYHHLLDAGA